MGLVCMTPNVDTIGGVAGIACEKAMVAEVCMKGWSDGGVTVALFEVLLKLGWCGEWWPPVGAQGAAYAVCCEAGGCSVVVWCSSSSHHLLIRAETGSLASMLASNICMKVV